MDRIPSKSPLTQAVQEYSDFIDSCDKSVFTGNYKKCYMYILVNKSLSMTPGKVAAQVGHAVERLTLACQKSSHYKAFRACGTPKIVLSVPTEEQFIEILDQTKKYTKVYIIDEGMTQVPKNSVTVVGYSLMYEHEIPSVLKTLSLYNR
jgi:peptidyl-tRNA hydrolase, PTH2 family